MKTSGKFKKIAGMGLIVGFSAINLVILFALIYTLIEKGDARDASITLFSFIFCMVIFSFPLNYGVRLWKSGIAELRDIPKPADGTIKTLPVQITLSDYRSLMMKLTFRTPIVLYVSFLGLSWVITGILIPAGDTQWSTLIGILFVCLPLLSLIQAKRNYDGSKNLKETIVYEFNVDNIIITGETFNATQRWSSLYKVKELNDWLLLYTNRTIAVCIPKSAFGSKGELDNVLSFALNAKGVKRELK